VQPVLRQARAAAVVAAVVVVAVAKSPDQMSLNDPLLSLALAFL